MPQSILGILAMMVASLIAMQMHQQVAQQQMRMIRNEVAMQSVGLAEDVLGEIGVKKFDENVKEEEANTSGALTPESDFGTNSGESIAIDDIDDFHNTPSDSSQTRMRLVADDTLRFGVRVRVSYARENDPETEVDSPTKAKKATVRVWSLNLAAPDTVEIARTFTCRSRCTW